MQSYVDSTAKPADERLFNLETFKQNGFIALYSGRSTVKHRHFPFATGG